MPKNKFNGFYYGIGMKLDEASIEQAGQQLEGRLNQVVDKVTQKVATMSDAIARGVKDVDTKELVKSLTDAQRELNQFNNFDPSKLQKQIDKLSGTVDSLGDQFKDVSSQLKTFTDDVASRLSNIEIRTSKQGKDALKRDLIQMRKLAQGYSDVMAKGVNIDTSELDAYIKRIKDGLASIKSSGNPMEMFADNELAHHFIAVTKILRQMGDSASSLRGDFYELSSAFKGVFEKSSAKGAQTIFKDIGYQIETVNAQLRKAQANLARYEDSIAKAQSRTKTTGFDITIEGDKNLNFDQKIAKIQEYGDIIAELDYGEAWATATKNQIALIQAAEKELKSILQTSDGQNALQKWQGAFGKYDLKDKLSTGVIADYVDGAKKSLQNLQALRQRTSEEIKAYEVELGKLMAREEITASSKKTKKSTKSSTQKQRAEGVAAEVEAKIKVNQKEWQKIINATIKSIEPKIKPFKIKVEATSGNILKEVKKIRDASLVNVSKDGSSDVKAFDNRYKKFYDNIVKRRQEIITELKQNWHPALKDAFSFRMELLGIDNKSMTENINTHLLSTVDTINTILAEKPLMFHSNIDSLLEEVQEKVKNLKLDGNIGLGAGNITVTPQSLGNVGIILNGIAQGGNNGPVQSAVPTNPIVPPSISPSSSSNKIPNIQEIYNSIGEIDRTTLTLESVREAAQKLEKRLLNAEDGTEEYYRSQIELAKLLAAWRYKIGSAIKGKAPEVAGVMGPGKGVAQKWNTYLKENSILLDPQNARILSKSALESKYGLSAKKSSGTSNHKSSSKVSEMTPEEISTSQLQAGKELVQHFIELAKLAKNLNSIREIADKPITADMFNDGEIEKWVRGKVYTKEDIGKYAPGQRATPEALDQFLSTMGITEADLTEANTKEEKEFLIPLKKYVHTFMQHRQQLNGLVQELVGGQNKSAQGIAQGYLDSGSDTTKYLVDELSDTIKKLVVKNPKTKAQELVSRVFANAGIDLSELASITDPHKQFELLQNQLLHRKTYTMGNGDAAFNVPWEQWLKNFSNTGYGANYEKLFALLKLGRQYSIASDSLSHVGQEADALIRGRTELRDKKIKKQNPNTGLWEETDEWKQIPKTVEQGLRGMLKSLQVIFEDATGHTLLGYNLGKGYIPDDIFLGANSGFTKIISELAKASSGASRIAFGDKMSTISGSKDVARWTPPSHTPDTALREYKFTKVSTEKKDIEKWISNINTLISGYKSTLKSLEQELTAIIAKDDNSLTSKDDISQISQTQTQIDAKQTALTQKRNQIAQQKNKIEELQRNLTNPAPLYEDILKSLLDEESKLAKLEADIAYKRENKKNYNDELEIDKLFDEKKQVKNRIKNLQASASVAPLGTDDKKINSEIEKETAEITRLEAELQQKQSADNQNEKVQLEQEIARKKTYIANLSNALQKRERIKTKEAIETEVVDRQTELNRMQEEETKLLNELSLLNEELSKFGSTDVVNRVIEIIRKQNEVAKKIESNQALLEQRQKEIKSADNKNLTYSKSYNQAVSDLPRAQEGQEIARENLMSLVNQYTSERMATVTGAIAQMKAGTLSDADAKKIQDNLYNIIELNKQLQDGTITHADYVDKVTQAYMLMRNATTDEANATAMADAEKLANAALLVKKYQEEETILKRIIRTQKPKEIVPAQPSETSSKQPSNQSQISTQTVVSGISGTANIKDAQNVVIPGGNIVLGGVASGTGLATENTVGKIYALLSVKKDDDYDSRIDKLKKLIVAKEAEEHKALENAQKKKEEEKKAVDEVKKKAIEENKGVEKIKQKVAEEKKSTDEVKKKVTEEKKAVTEVEKKPAEEKKAVEADKQKTQEVKKQVDAEKSKTTESKKQVVSEKTETKEATKQVAVSQEFENSVKRIIGDLLSALSGQETYKLSGRRVAPTQEQIANYKNQQINALNSLMSIFGVNSKDIDAFSQGVIPKNAAFRNGIGARNKTINSIYGNLMSQYGNGIQNVDQIAREMLDPVQQALNKETKDLFKSFVQYNDEVAKSLRIFREHYFNITGDKVADIKVGTMTHATVKRNGQATAGGHMHPRHDLYSGADLDWIRQNVRTNHNYNTDYLVTPQMMTRISGLQDLRLKSPLQFNQFITDLTNAFETLKSNPFINVRDAAKLSYLKHTTDKYGVDFSAYTIDENGNVSDAPLDYLSKELTEKIISLTEKNLRLRVLPKDNPSYQTMYEERAKLLAELGKNEVYTKLKAESPPIQDAYEGWQQERLTSVIQSVLDNDLDISKFYDEIKDIVDQQPTNKNNQKIKRFFMKNQGLDPTNINQIIPELKQYFGYSKGQSRDPRHTDIFAKKGINPDEHRVHLDGVEQVYIDGIENKSLEELRAELTHLEELRDNGEVDPRFATAEKQDVIIDLLKNGVKIAGKGVVNEKNSDGATTKKKEEPKRVSQGQTIDIARKEIDSTKNAASTTVKDTGEIITKTAQKCGAEILNITKTVKNGVTSTTASINNEYETAMKKTRAQIGAKASGGLFGEPYDANTNIETTDAQAALNKYIETYAKLEELIVKFKGLNLSTASGKTEASKLQIEIDAAQKDLDFFEDKLINISSNTEKFLGGKEAFSVMDTKALDQTGVSLKLLAQQTEGAMVAFNGLYNDGTKLVYDVFDPASSTFKRYSLEVDKATGYVRKMETAQTGLVNAFQNVNKVHRQFADLNSISGVNSSANIIKQYNKARKDLDKAVNDAWAKAKSENRLISLDEQKEIYAMSNEVLRLGKRILSTANSFKTFEAEGGQTFEVIREKAESLESAIRKIATNNALDDKMSISNISYNDVTKKLSYDLTDLDGNVRRVTMAYVDMFNQVKITSDNSLAAMDKVSAGIQEDSAIISNAIDSGLIDVRTDTYKNYEKELKEMIAYKDQLDAKDDRLTQNEIDNLNMRKTAVKALGDELVATAKKNSAFMGQGSKDVANEVSQKNTLDVGINNFGALSGTKAFQTYSTLYEAMIQKQEEFKQNGILAGQSEQDQLSRMAKATRLARIEFEQLAKASAEFDAKIGDGQTKSGVDPKNLEAEMKAFVLSQDGLTQSQREMIEQTWSFKNAQDGATYSVSKGKNEVASMSVIFDQGTNRIGQYTIETNKYRTGMEKFMDSLKGKWQEVARYLMTFGSFYQVLNVFRQGITYVREIDSALTELKKVTDETEESYDKFLDTAAKTASKVGSTIKDVVSSTADWARLGYSLEDAATLAETTSVLLNVSEFKSIEDATSALTSTLQAFSMTADTSMNAVDVLNEIGNNFAISSDGIATALQDSASSLVAANNSYEEAVALIASANRVVQDPNSVGAALRTISLRLRGTSAKELEESGEDTDGVISTKSKLRSKIKGLSGVDILTDTGAYKSTYEILLEISKVWDNMTDMNRAGLLEIIAGKTRSNTAAAILSNTKDLEEAYKSAMDAEGSALKENEKYLDSIQGRIDLFTNAVQNFWNNLLESDAIKFVVNLGTKILEAASAFGELKSILFVVLTYLNMTKKIDLVKWIFGSNGLISKLTKLKKQVNKENIISPSTSVNTTDSVGNIGDSARKVKQNFTTIWQHHNKQVDRSMQYTSEQFNKLETSSSNVSGGIKSDVHNVASSIKTVFGKLTAPITKIFNHITSGAKNTLDKVKTTVKDTAKAFKSNFDSNNGTSNIPTWLSAGSSLTAEDLKIPTNAAEEIDKINAASEQGESALNDLMVSYGNSNKALQAYIASLNGGKASLSGFKAFCDAQNASLKATGPAALIARVGVVALQTALSWGLAVVIQLIVNLLGKFIDYLKDLANPTKKLSEDISDLKSNISDTKSEMDSINDSLETCRDCMAELLALPSLSFTEQEELNKLEKDIALLERKLKLQEALLASQEAQLVINTEDYIDEAWDKQGKYYVDFQGRIKDDSGWNGFWYNSKKTTKILDDSIKKYKDREEAIAKAEEVLLNFDNTSVWKKDAALIDLNTYFKDSDQIIARSIARSSKEKYAELIEEAKKANAEVAKSIEDVFADPSYAGLSYGMSDDIDAFLDEFYAYQDKWNVMLGTASRTDSIETLFDKTASTEMQNLGKQLQEIADDESLSVDKQNEKIKEIISNIDLESDAYSRLKIVMDTVGVTAQNIADYFTLENGVFDSNTIEGVTAQYAYGLKVLNQLKNGNNFSVNDETIGWDNLFEEDDAGKFKARVDKFGAILKGVDKETRETFVHLAESVKNGTLTWEEAANSFQASGLVAACRLVEEEISSLNTEVFKDLSDELSGVIDTFSEFSAALESVAGSMEILNTAQTQMVNSGRISVKTALELMQSTDNWNELLEIENGNIRLVDNATEILVQSKLDLIKKNLQSALATVEAQLAEVTATQASADLAYTIEESTNLAVQQLAGNMAYLTKIMEAYARQASGEKIDISDWIGQAEDAKEAVLEQTNYKKNSAERIGTEALEKKKAELEAMLEMYEGIDTGDEFNDYYDYDKTPGDKDLDGSDGRDSDALESLRNKYERKIENLDNQQTYLQNEIDRLEAENKAVSRSYYDEQIAIEEKKLGLYEQERAALLKLNMTDEVAEALWEVEHAIQESTMRMVEFRQAIVDLYVDAFDKIIGSYDNLDDFLSDQQNYIDKYQELMELQGKPVTSRGIKEQTAIEEKKLFENMAELDALRAQLNDAMANGLEEGTEEWVDMQDKIRATEEAILDNKIAIEQYRDELNQLAVDAFELVRGAFSNKDNFLTGQQDYIQGYIDLLEAQGIDVPEAVYQKLIDIENQKRENLVADLKDAQTGLDNIGNTLWNNAVASNPEMANWTEEQKNAWLFTQDEYVEGYNNLTETEKKIQDCDIATAQWEKNIRDMDFDKFERFTSRLDDIHSEIDNLRGLFDDDDVANKDGTWTEEGITSLGLAVQQMELAQQKSQEYAEKIEELNTAYKNGEMSEQEYYERLQELKNGQWDAIDAYETAKDTIVDMEEARIDMIEKGLNEEIEAYQELIDVKKEELDAERDLYDFKKKVKDQTKDLAELDRRIASLSGSTADADIAELRKLKAERHDLQEGLDDTYYQHSKDTQSKALDDEMTKFQEIREEYVESLRDTLEDTMAIVAQKMAEVLVNADTVYNGVTNTANEYGVTLTDALVSPWETAKNMATEFKNTATEDIASLINEDGIITLFGSEETKLKITNVFGSGSAAANKFKSTVQSGIAIIREVVFNSTSELTSKLNLPWSKGTGAANTFSETAKNAINGAVNLAKEKASAMTSSLTSPWKEGKTAINTWSTGVKTALKNAVQEAIERGKQISEALDVEVPSYTGSGSGGGNSGNSGGKSTDTTYVSSSDSRVKTLQEILNTVFLSKLKVDGIWGSATTTALKQAQKTMGISQTGKYNATTRFSMITFVDGIIKRALKDGVDTTRYKNAKSKIQGLAAFAKGTMGTSKSQWAITDEPWLGDELTLVPTAQGNLSYMRKGTSVVPADITENLVKWGQLNPDMTSAADAIHGVNLMSNYVNKPELNLTFDALVKAQNITEETLPAVKKLVTEELDKFTRKLNYSLKRV